MTQWGLDTIFNPGKRHMDEEKLRLQSVRAEVGDNSGGKRIDLDSGRVTISRAGDDDTTDEATDEASAQAAATESPAASTSPAATKDDDVELTPAQQRARDRRRRAAKK